MSAKATILSGFCNRTHPLDSHLRCHLEQCTCKCHTFGTQAPPASNPVDAVAESVEALGKALPALTEACTDPQATDLAQLLLDVRESRQALYQLEQDLEGITAKALMDDYVQTDTLRVERYRSRDRKEWAHEDWQRDVRAKVLQQHGLKGAQGLLTADGEVVPASVLHEVLRAVESVHGAGQPKTTALRALGLDAADYCRTEPGSAHVRIVRLADETATEGEADDA